MTETSKLIYKLGGYDYKIIEKINPITTHFGMRYLIPGLSLLIIFLTAGFGGWHFTATLINNEEPNYEFKHFLGTLFFAFFVFFIDYIILNSGKNKLILIARVILSFGLGSIVAILTTLSFFSNDIRAENDSQKNLRLNPIDSIYDAQKAAKDSSITKSQNRITALRDSAIAERQGRTKSGKAGPGGNWEEIHKNITLDSIQVEQTKLTLSADKAEIEKDRKREKDKIEKEFSSKDFISQVKSLWRLMKETIVSIYTFIFLVALIICDLIPLLAKVSKDYSDDYDPYKEYINSLREKVKVKEDDIELDYRDIELIKTQNDFELSKFNEDALKKMNSLFALEKYQELIEYFKTKNIPQEAIGKIFDKLHEEAKTSESNGE